ncbi:hypothetical protein L1A22_25060 [Pseudomonas extremaustralis]|uniref:hypothetical protein n=2 Tax=Pseudomonas extremaustralis TaxID=359110 RepID=UPI0021C567B1|nr:hypothetical protein [Pseudomonas extremaustralis]UUJ39939.1 hypothetical protein L1A22_25060 [Pseudomonas extremaustralis]
MRSRNRIYSLFPCFLIAATMMAIVPVSFAATAQDIERLRHSNMDQMRQEAQQRADEQARQAREQMRQLEERNRQQAKDLEEWSRRQAQEREEAARKAQEEAREKQLREDAERANPDVSPAESRGAELPQRQ